VTAIGVRLSWNREEIDAVKLRRDRADAAGDQRAALYARRDLLRTLLRFNLDTGGGFREVMSIFCRTDRFLDRYADALGPEGVDALIDCFDQRIDREDAVV